MRRGCQRTIACQLPVAGDKYLVEAVIGAERTGLEGSAVTVSKRSWRECRFHALLALGFVCVSCLHRLGAVTWREAPLYRQGRWSLSEPLGVARW
jgi:hypothetical protein